MYEYDYPKADNTASVIAFCRPDYRTVTVLLIRRGKDPFRGKLALPGGFLEIGKETLEECAARELLEETGVSGVYPPKQVMTNSSPMRDPRGHVIDTIFKTMVLEENLMAAKAGDDAAEIIHTTFTVVKPQIDIAEYAFDHGMVLHHFIKSLHDKLVGI